MKPKMETRFIHCTTTNFQMYKQKHSIVRYNQDVTHTIRDKKP